MSMRGILYVLATLILLSCTKEEENCGGKNYYKVHVLGIGYELYKRLDHDWEPDTMQPIEYDYLRIALGCEYEHYYSQRISPPLRFSFISSAYACSPIEVPVLVNKLTNLKVVSNNDYNDSLPAGYDIQSLFTSSGQTLYSVFSNSVGNEFGLRFPPAKKSIHQFKFEFEYDDTLSFSAELPALLIE